MINEETLYEYDIPQYMYAGILAYVNQGIIPGRFLRSILENDLRNSIANADDTNINHLKDYVMFFYNEVPGTIWGSCEKVERHAKSFGR